VIYSYNKNQQDAVFLKFIFGIELYMLRKGLLSIIRSLVLYTQKQVYVIQCNHSKKLSYSVVSRSRWDTATDKYVGKVVILYCMSYIHFSVRDKFETG
jgi:hypothetical protein